MTDNDDLDTRSNMHPFNLELSSLLSDLDRDGTRLSSQTMIMRGFREIAGQTVSEHTRSIHFSQGVVTAVMDSGIWAQELSFLADEYRVKLNDLLGGEVVTVVKFRTRLMR
ncbi:MAG: DUF721 domain-containing protein [Actinomycetia bacterium]|nr:DUF721 domain-containing protein [Actinomycetes bacterium]